MSSDPLIKPQNDFQSRSVLNSLVKIEAKSKSNISKQLQQIRLGIRQNLSIVENSFEISRQSNVTNLETEPNKFQNQLQSIQFQKKTQGDKLLSMQYSPQPSDLITLEDSPMITELNVSLEKPKFKIESLTQNLVARILHKNDQNPFQKNIKNFEHRVRTPVAPTSELQQVIKASDLLKIQLQKVEDENRNLCLQTTDQIYKVKQNMYDSIDKQMAQEQIRQRLDNDPNFYQEIEAKRNYFQQLKFGKVDTHPYDVIKNMKGYKALMKHQEMCRKIHIPNYKVVKKIRGVEQITEHEINCNNDVIQLWRQELNEQKQKLESPDTDRQYLQNDYKEIQRNDALWEDQLWVGQKAIKNAEQIYKNASRIKEKNEMNEADSTPLVDYFNEIQSRGMLPKTKGLIKSKQNERADQMFLQSFYIRKEQAHAIAKGLQTCKYITTVCLRNCGLTDETFLEILQSLDKFSLLELDISYNPGLTAKSYNTLAELIQDPGFRLKVLNLDSNLIGNSNLVKLLTALLEQNYIECLELSNCKITDQGAKSLALFINQSAQLRVLMLKYNQIMGKGGVMIAQEIKYSEKLQVFDISFNSITGQGQIPQIPELQKVEHARQRYADEVAAEENRQSKAKTNITKQKPQNYATMFAEAWRDAFKENKSLVHVDISHNRMSKIDVEIIAEGLKDNHSIFGIHFQGNAGYIDNKGFVVAANEEFASDSILMTKMKTKLDSAVVKSPQRLQLQVNSNCWICEGWTQVKFKFQPGISDDSQDHDPFKAIKLHLEIDQYIGDLMVPDETGDYTCYRFLPPGTHKYFYSVANKLTVAQDQPFESNNTTLEPPKIPKRTIEIAEPEVESLEKKYFANLSTRDSLAPSQKPQGESTFQKTLKKALKKAQAEKWDEEEPEYYEIEVPYTNIIKNLKRTAKLYTKEELAQQIAVPRPPPKELDGRKKLRTPWKFNLSIFKDYKVDNPKLLDNCFEADWNNSKIDRIVKDEEEQNLVKKLLKQNYIKFRESYKQLSGVDPQKDLLCIGNNTFSDVVNSLTGFIDGKNINLADLDLEFISTNANAKSNKRNPERMLVRHNWMEIFVRLAVTRFVKKEKIAAGPYQAIQIMIDSYLDPFFAKFQASNWRKNVLHKEEIDLTLKHGIRVLKEIYLRYSGRFANPGAPKYMSLTEFMEIFQDSGIFNENFGQKQLPMHFAISMMTQIDELEQDRHMNMTFAEFAEAIVRVSELTNIPNLVEDSYNIDQIIDGSVQESDRAIYQRRNLQMKIESVIYLLCIQQCPKIFSAHKNTVEKYKKIGVYANDIDTGNIKFQ